MNLSKPFYALMLLIFFSLGCQKDTCITKDQFLDNFNAFISELEKKDDNLTSSEKSQYEERYKSIVENCYKKYKEKLTLKERQDFWKSSLKYYLAKQDGDISINISDNEDEFTEYVKNEISEVIKDSGRDIFGPLGKVLKVELPKFLDSLSDELEKFGEEIEKIVEDK